MVGAGVVGELVGYVGRAVVGEEVIALMGDALGRWVYVCLMGLAVGTLEGLAVGEAVVGECVGGGQIKMGAPGNLVLRL